MKNLKPTNITELNIDLDESGIVFDDIIPEALLDLRYKKLTFANHNQRINTENKLRILYNKLLQTYESESTILINSTTTWLNFHTDNPIQKYKVIIHYRLQVQYKSVMQDKIENYLKMDEIEIKKDPFKW
ncbi:10974_t:CDS:2 [Funneliformis caledonium]|uniref:10974_t:CDS:1 n=1 Tax=Funneliformis caledonium TaxID=1117310 RepID=A0A9N9DER7_9GLOM|nr:10974_t:CDS:2 [Funneliformis caledonium]